MLLKLGDSLGTWTPRNGGGDPLAVVRSAWLRLVGGDVARAAQPVAITNETLVVYTTSSAWSHQLAFLEPHIMRGIRDLELSASIVKLRFRVGVIRNRGTSARSLPASQPGVRGADAARRPPPCDAAEALRRFRTTVERSQAAHRARGGVFCCDCAAPTAGSERCVPCAHWQRDALEARCQRLLFDAPWLPAQEVLDSLPGLAAADYDGIRRRLLQSWWDEMKLAHKRTLLPRPIAPNRGRLRKIASSYVLLETKLDPNRLEMDSPVRRNALGELYEFIRSVEQPALP